MKKELFKKIVSATILGVSLLVVSIPSTTHARVYDPGILPCAIGDRAFTDAEGKKWCDTEPATNTSAATTDSNASTGDSDTATAEDEGNPLKQVGDAIVGGVTHVGLVVFLAPVAAISFVILAFTSFLLTLAGILFNWSLTYLVFNFGVYFGNSTGLLLAWGILRDFGNIILLFGFVYMGIQTILNINHFDVGKTLSRLVIFAVLLNFSLFISEAIIDVTNGLTSALYSQMSNCVITDTNCMINNGVSTEIFDRAGIMSALGFGTQSGPEQTGSGGGSNYFANPIGETLKFLGLSILITTAFVVLIAGVFLLLSRAIHLTFLMVVSPIGFAGMAVPWLEKMAQEWWDSLIKQAMFAPVFLLLLFVSLKLLDGLDGLAGDNGGIASAIQSPDVINTGPILFFALVIGFMIGSILVAKKFGIYGAEVITKTAVGVIKGSAAYPFTPWRDMTGNYMKNKGKAYNVMAGDIAKRFNDSKIIKAIPLAKPILGAAGAVVDDAIAGGFKGAQNIKVGGSSFADRQKARDEREKAGTDALRQDTLKKNLNAAIEKAKTGDTDDLQKVINNDASVSDLLEHKAFKGEDDDALRAMVDVGVMSGSRFKQIMDSKEVSEEVKTEAKRSRFAPLGADIRTGGDALKKWSGDDVVASGLLNDRTQMVDFVHKASDSQFEAITKNSNIGGQLAQRMRDIREGTGPDARFNPANAKRFFDEMGPSAIAQLKGSVLTTNANLLGAERLQSIMASKKLKPADQAAIGTYVESLMTRPWTSLTMDERQQRTSIQLHLRALRFKKDRLREFKKYYKIP